MRESAELKRLGVAICWSSCEAGEHNAQVNLDVACAYISVVCLCSQAGYIVAAGGAAQRPFVVQTATESGPTGSQCGQHRPAHLQALLNELESLETAHKNVRKACSMMSSALLKAFIIWVVIAAVPPIWSRISYIIPVHSLSWLIPSIGLVKLYGCKRTTRNSASVQRV